MRLAGKFHLAGALLVCATLACGAFAVYMFARLSYVVKGTLAQSQRTLDLAAELASLLEREDDAVLQTVAHAAGAREDLEEVRRRFDQGFAQILPLLSQPAEVRAASALSEHVAAYRRAADSLAGTGEPSAGLKRYHGEVNALLRQASADLTQVRAYNFEEMGQAGVRARDMAQRATRVVTGVLALAVLVSLAAALYLVRLVVRPVRELTASVDALRRGEFGRRVKVASPDELGQLAEGFNRMAEALDDFRRTYLDELRSEMVAVASHELKTPLTTLRMNLMLLSEDRLGLSPRQQEILATALLGCEDLAGIIERLLDVARIEAGQLPLVREPVQVGDLCAEVAARLRARAVDAGIDLSVFAAPDLPRARVDAGRIALVLTNLLSNALKYTPPGGRVRLSCASRQDAGLGGGPVLQIAVTDTGPGIPAELRERVFEKFFRVEHQLPGRDRGVKGAGLGLYLCRRVVEAHGGAIAITEGDEGRGARVGFTLPTA